MARSALRRQFVCQSCGTVSPKWLGRCPGCGEWESLVEESAAPVTSSADGIPSVAYQEVDKQTFERIATGSVEFDRVLGGGIVPGSLILIGGEPGVGKSTLLLQLSENLSKDGRRVLYVAGEESAQQIKMRGDRLGVEGARLLLAGETCVERILLEVEQQAPHILIIDSIQTVHTEKLDSIPGSIGQIRECAVQFLNLSKRRQICVFLIGHITKDGALAGPKALEHVVDVVLYFEGDRHQNQKIVRAVKNRFGPANELGIFEMTSHGLLGVENPSGLFLSERATEASGSAVLAAVQGSRPLLVEVQALVSRSNYSTSRRMANGIDSNRVALLLAMLEKRIGFDLLGCDVYVNVAGGLSVVEPASDLPAVAAIVSSFQDLPIPSDMMLFGEIGLAGEVRAVNFSHSRVKEAAALGFKRIVLPQGNLPLAEKIEGVQLRGVVSVLGLLEELDF